MILGVLAMIITFITLK